MPSIALLLPHGREITATLFRGKELPGDHPPPSPLCSCRCAKIVGKESDVVAAAHAGEQRRMLAIVPPCWFTSTGMPLPNPARAAAQHVKKPNNQNRKSPNNNRRPQAVAPNNRRPQQPSPPTVVAPNPLPTAVARPPRTVAAKHTAGVAKQSSEPQPRSTQPPNRGSLAVGQRRTAAPLHRRSSAAEFSRSEQSVETRGQRRCRGEAEIAGRSHKARTIAAA
nr:hypothetical protein Iba_chr12cCG13620 [Ipomoea batatas]